MANPLFTASLLELRYFAEQSSVSETTKEWVLQMVDEELKERKVSSDGNTPAKFPKK